jgi:hypothetical protein
LFHEPIYSTLGIERRCTAVTGILAAREEKSAGFVPFTTTIL